MNDINQLIEIIETDSQLKEIIQSDIKFDAGKPIMYLVIKSFKF
jgi:hypothetical protein